MGTLVKIMVVDDEKHICQNVEKILKKNNYDVVQATSAKEALEKMTKESFSLLISDIVMPEMNGLELLELTKEKWPHTKAVMMTGYASTDTAFKAIRLGAQDYICKPFTPDELRSSVDLVLAGELVETLASEKEKKEINIIDVDIPFDREEVAKYTSDEYADRLGPSDMPVIQAAPETLKNYCSVGLKVCEIFEKLANICKAGNKTGECPQLKAKKKKGKKGGFDPTKMIGIDCPFNYEEVVSITGPEYVMHLQRDGFSFLPYEELKKNVAQVKEKEFERDEVYHELPRERAHKHILVIDDEVAVNNNIRKILSKQDYIIDQAVTKGEALDKIRDNEYDLILLDLRIPEVKGLELLKAIHDQQPDTMVIIITGYASIETALESAKLGAIDYLAKPFAPDEIRNATERAFRLAA